MIDQDELKKLVDSHRIGSLAVITPEGKPHNTPVWINYKDGFLVVFTRDYRVKTKYAKANPHCMISYDDGAIVGEIEVISRGTDAYTSIMDTSDEKYSDDPGYPEYKKNWNTALKIKVSKLYIF